MQIFLQIIEMGLIVVNFPANWQQLIFNKCNSTVDAVQLEANLQGQFSCNLQFTKLNLSYNTNSIKSYALLCVLRYFQYINI